MGTDRSRWAVTEEDVVGLTDDDRAEVAALVREELRAEQRRSAVRAEVRRTLAEVADDPAAPDLAPSDRPAAGPVGPLTARLGFPPHALLAALPLGALFCCSAFDVAAHLAPEPYTYPRSSYWLLVLGLATAAAAVVAGILDHRILDPTGARADASRRHQVVVYAAIGLSVLSLVLRRRTDFVDEVPIGIVLLSLLSLALLVVGSAMGARLTYRLGVGQAPAPPPSATPPAPGPTDDVTPTDDEDVDEAALEDGDETDDRDHASPGAPPS